MRFQREDRTRFILLTLLYLLLLPPLFPNWSVNLFFPLIIFSLLAQQGLPLAFACGLMSDLFISDMALGWLTLFSLVAYYLVGRIKHLITEDSFFSLALFTLIYSIVIDFLQLIFKKGIGLEAFLTLFQWEWITHPFANAIFASLAFSLPLFLAPMSHRRKKPALFRYKKG